MKLELTLYSQPFPKKMLKRSEDFYSYLEKNGVRLGRGFIKNYNPKRKLFTKALFLENGRWIWKKNIKPDAIYDRSLFYINPGQQKKRKLIERNFFYFNPLELSELLSNKWLTYKKFPDFSPKTILIKNKGDITKINRLSSDRVILKPLAGSGGKGIKIQEKKFIKPLQFPFIVQELIDSSRGIHGLAKGPHDLRVMILNDRIFHCFLRIPVKGKLIANLSQGGKIKIVPTRRLPKNAIRLINVIKKEFKKYPVKFYSIDIIFDENQNPWIIEMNSRPGIILEKEELKVRKNYYDSLIKFFKN